MHSCTIHSYTIHSYTLQEYSDEEDQDVSCTSELETYVRHIWSDSIEKEVAAVLSKLADCRCVSVTQLVSMVVQKPSDKGGGRDERSSPRRRRKQKKTQLKCCYYKGHPCQLNHLVIVRSNGRCFKTTTLEQLVNQAAPFVLKEEQRELQLLQTKLVGREAVEAVATVAAAVGGGKGGKGGGGSVGSLTASRALNAVQAQGNVHRRLPNLRAALVRPRHLTLTACPTRQEFYSTYASKSWGTSLVKDEVDPLGLRDRSLRDTSGVKSGTRCMTVHNPWKVRALIDAYTHTLIHSYSRTCTHTLIHALIHSCTHTPTHPLTHAYALTHMRMHSTHTDGAGGAAVYRKNR
jgi:hypothetical protein